MDVHASPPSRSVLADSAGEPWRFPDRYQAAQMADLVGGGMIVLGNVQYPFAVEMPCDPMAVIRDALTFSRAVIECGPPAELETVREQARANNMNTQAFVARQIDEALSMLEVNDE